MDKIKTRIYSPPEGLSLPEVQTLIDSTIATGLIHYPRWVGFQVRFEDFAQAGFSNTETLTAIDGEAIYVHDVKIIPSEDFSGGLIATYTLSVGIDGGSNVLYAIATDVFTGNTTLTAPHTPLPSIQDVGPNGLTLTCTAISTVDTLDNATAGIATIWVLYSQLVKP